MTRADLLKLWGGLLVAAGLGGWFAAPPPIADAKLVTARREAWQLPLPPSRPADNAPLGLISQAPFWGLPTEAASPAAAAALEDTRWRIAAIYGEGDQRVAMVVYFSGKKPPQRFKAGDTLPSGHRITRIADRAVFIRIGKREFPLGLDRSEL